MFQFFFMSVISTGFTLSAFSGGELVQSFHIMGVLHIGFHKFTPLGDTFILVFIGRDGMFKARLDPGRNIIGDQFDQSCGGATRQRLIRGGDGRLNISSGFQPGKGRSFAGTMDFDKSFEKFMFRSLRIFSPVGKGLLEGGTDRLFFLRLNPFEDWCHILSCDRLLSILNYRSIQGVTMRRSIIRDDKTYGDKG